MRMMLISAAVVAVLLGLTMLPVGHAQVTIEQAGVYAYLPLVFHNVATPTRTATVRPTPRPTPTFGIPNCPLGARKGPR